MAIIITESALLRLLQLASASLPVGGFAYSQGMEYAVDAGWIADPDACEAWLGNQLQYSMARVDLALVFRIYAALESDDAECVAYWNDYLLASRETQELRLTDTAMGKALVRLMPTLDQMPPALAPAECSFVTAFCSAAWQWQLGTRACALALCWSWLENQVAAATKLVPLGQTQAQQLLGRLQRMIPGVIDLAQSLDDSEIGAGLPAQVMASSLHETQYSRLFRS